MVAKQKDGVNIKILDVASYEDLCILREKLVDAKKAVNWCLNHADEAGFKIAMDFVNKWGF